MVGGTEQSRSVGRGSRGGLGRALNSCGILADVFVLPDAFDPVSRPLVVGIGGRNRAARGRRVGRLRAGLVRASVESPPLSLFLPPSVAHSGAGEVSARRFGTAGLCSAKAGVQFVGWGRCPSDAAVHEWYLGRWGWQAPCLSIELSALRPLRQTRKCILGKRRVPVLPTHAAEVHSVVGNPFVPCPSQGIGRTVQRLPACPACRFGGHCPRGGARALGCGTLCERRD